VQNLWRSNVKDFQVNTGFSLMLDNVYLAKA
jgi:peptide/nickel transport system substrate-binding protein